MATPQRPNFNTGAIQRINPGDALINMASIIQKQEALDLDRERQAKTDARQDLLFKQQQEDRDKKLAQQDILKNYTLDKATALDSQRKVADKTLIDKYDLLNAAADKAVIAAGYDPKTVANELGSAGYDALLAKAGVANPALTAQQARSISGVYDNATPWQEDVKAKVYRDLVSQGVDATTAMNRATIEASQFLSAADTQKLEKETTKEWNTKDKDALDRQLKVLEFQMKAIDKENDDGGGSKSGSNYVGGNLKSYLDSLGTNFDWLAFVKDEQETASKWFMGLTKGITNEKGETTKLSPKAALEALQRSTVDGVIDEDLIKENMKLVKNSGYNNMTSEQLTAARDQIMKNVTDIYNFKPARSIDVRSEREKLLGSNMSTQLRDIFSVPTSANADKNKVTNDTTVDKNKVLSSGKQWSTPKFLSNMENIKQASYKPYEDGEKDGKKFYSIGYGYNSNKNLEVIKNDFKKAGIDPALAEKFRSGEDLDITSDQANKLRDIAWNSNLQKGRNVGIDIDNMTDDKRNLVGSLLYRGDIVQGDSGYRGELHKMAKDGLVTTKELIDYIENNENVPKELKNRIKKFEYVSASAVGNTDIDEQTIEEKAEILKSSKEGPTKENIDLLDKLDQKIKQSELDKKYKESVKRSEALKNYMSTSGLGANPGERAKMEWEATKRIIEKIPDSMTFRAIKGIYDKYQEYIGMPFSEFVNKYAPGGRR